VLEGSVLRIARGVYALPGADPLLVHAASHHAVPGCVTAANAAGLWVVRRPGQPHLAARHGRPVVGCVVHRSPVPLTSLDIVCQALRCLPPLEGLTIAESAVKKGLVQLPELRERFPAAREKSVRGLVARIRPQSGSIIETMARYLLEEAGLTVELQVKIPGMGHLDLLVDGLLGIETDGYAHHSNREAYREDRRRWNVTVVRGVPTLRVTFEMLQREPEEFVRMVRQALATYRTAR
jgi:very-short-patch-repair endonuclease